MKSGDSSFYRFFSRNCQMFRWSVGRMISLTIAKFCAWKLLKQSSHKAFKRIESWKPCIEKSWWVVRISRKSSLVPKAMIKPWIQIWLQIWIVYELLLDNVAIRRLLVVFGKQNQNFSQNGESQSGCRVTGWVPWILSIKFIARGKRTPSHTLRGTPCIPEWNERTTS